MRLGYSHTLLHREQSLGIKLDGIGIYTKCLYAEMSKHHDQINAYDFCRLKQVFNKGSQQPATILSAALPGFINLHKSMEQQIDVFHSTDYLIPRLKSTAVVATLHDAIMLKNPELASGMRKLKNQLLKRSATWANHVITVSHAMVEDIVDYWNIKPENISAVHNGLDDIWYEKFSQEKINQVLKKYAINKPFILNVGTLQPRKNIQRLIKAYQALPNALQTEFQLIVVGKKGWNCDDIIQQLQQLQAKGQGKWIEYAEFEELRALYQAATIFAFPSLTEGFGFPVIESFASQTPVLAANTTSIPEIAENAALLIDPTDIEAIAHGLETLLNNENLQQHYISLGLDRAKHFSWQQSANETYQILKQFA